jgi:hypothetical protein
MDLVQRTEKELEAARVLRAQIADLAGGDEDFVRDTLEGEVDFEAIVRSLLASIGEDEAMVTGLKAYADELAGRKDRIEKRIAFKRTLIASALEIADRPKLELDVGTVSLTKVQPKAEITEEAEIPADFWKPQPPKLDKSKLTAALKEGQSVPGAMLGNGGITCTIRRK